MGTHTPGSMTGLVPEKPHIEAMQHACVVGHTCVCDMLATIWHKPAPAGSHYTTQLVCMLASRPHFVGCLACAVIPPNLANEMQESLSIAI